MPFLTPDERRKALYKAFDQLAAESCMKDVVARAIEAAHADGGALGSDDESDAESPGYVFQNIGTGTLLVFTRDDVAFLKQNRIQVEG